MFSVFQIICIWVVMHHASCPGAPPPIRPSTHSKASGHSCHSNNKNSTTAPRLHPPSATPWTPVKKHLTLIPIPTPHLSKFSHLAINVDWWVISSTDHQASRYDVLCCLHHDIFPKILLHISLSRQYCCTFLSAGILPPRQNISHNIGSRCAKSFIVD